MNGKLNGQISSVDLRTSGSISLNWKHLSCNIQPFTALAFIFLGVMLTVFCIHGQCYGASDSEDSKGSANNAALPAQGWDAAAGGIPQQDLSVADVIMLKKMAESGDPESQFLMGYVYFEGAGMLQDRKMAIEMWRRAAEKDHVIAQYNLGTIYHQGISVPQDFSESYKWTKKSAERGFPLAEFCLGEHYKFGDGVAQDYSEALNWFHKSAQHGYPDAQYQVGLFFSSGKGVTRNHNLSIQWFRRAAAQGHHKSMEVLAENQVQASRSRAFGLTTPVR
jgi:hypothetical protein